MAEQASDDAGGRLLLDDQLCFALYAATNAITRRYRPLLSEIGLTYPQYLVMLALWQDGPSAVGRIAERLELDSHAVSPLIDRLADSGLVERRPGTDRRQVVVVLTERGVDLEVDAARAQARVACATGLADLEFADLRRRLRDLTAQLSHPEPDRSPTPDRRSTPQQAERTHQPRGEAS